jgi:hypothetical protein
VAVGHFRRKREAPLTVEGHPPDTERAIPGPLVLPPLCTFPGCVVVDQVVTAKLRERGILLLGLLGADVPGDGACPGLPL